MINQGRRLSEVGDVISYYSTSLGDWIPAKILSVNDDGSYRLDCKDADVLPAQVRRRTRSQEPLHRSEWQCSSTGPYSAGDMVEYFSATSGNWIVAKVLARTPDGKYDLDCKPGVSFNSIRPRYRAASVGTKSRNSDRSSTTCRDLLRKQLSVAPTLNPAQGLLAMEANATVTACDGSEVPFVEEREDRRTPTFADLGANRVLFDSPWDPPVRGRAEAPLSPSQGPGKCPSSTELGSPMQLVSVSYESGRWQYAVCPQAAEVLESHGARPITVLSMCGASHTGKSYLMNFLLSGLQDGAPPPLFEVGSSTLGCTQGLWLCSLANSSAAQRQLTHTGPERAPLYAFIDCEGFGGTHSDHERDAHLMMLCILLSSTLLVNARGVLSESLFNTLAGACRCAEQATSHIPGAGPPDLLMVVRDFALELVSDQGCPMTPSEYLQQMLLAVPLAGQHSERGCGALGNRQVLMNTFPSRKCVTLIRPVLDEFQLGSLDTLPSALLRRDFREGVEAMRAELMHKLRSKKQCFDGSPLDCVAFVALLRRLVALLNSDSGLRTVLRPHLVSQGHDCLQEASKRDGIVSL